MCITVVLLCKCRRNDDVLIGRIEKNIYISAKVEKKTSSKREC